MTNNRDRARRHLPRLAFDFVDGGADDEVTLRRNREAFDDLALVPRLFRGVGNAFSHTSLYGQRLRMPVLLAPAGAGLVAGPKTYIAAARGAAAAGTISILSTSGSSDLASVAGATSEPQWFQVHLTRDREALSAYVADAKRLGFSALVLTGDMPVAGNRERDVQNGLIVRNGVKVPVRLITPRAAIDAVRRPRWTREYFSGNIRGRLREVKSIAETVRASLNVDQTWDDVKWLRDRWDGPMLVKGVMCAEDAALVVDAGCDGVIVSNHGGRQLDGVPAAIEVLPEVVRAVNGRAEVLLDGGVRRGTDVVKALSLGASACVVGRPWVFAVAVDGEVGVRTMLERFHEEIIRGLQLLGASSLEELNAEFVRRRPGAGWQQVEPANRAERRPDLELRPAESEAGSPSL